MDKLLSKIFFLLVHVVWFELPLVLILTVLASWHLANMLDKHEARGKEAKFARQVAAFYAALTFVLILASEVLG